MPETPFTAFTLSKYRAVELLGKGGFGTVYRAIDTTLDREVALKVLHPQLVADPTFVERFRTEAKIIAALHLILTKTQWRSYELLDMPISA